MEAWRGVANYLEDLWPQEGSCVARCESESRTRPVDEIYETMKACKEVCHDRSVKSSNDSMNACMHKCSSGQISKVECVKICVEANQLRDIH